MLVKSCAQNEVSLQGEVSLKTVTSILDQGYQYIDKGYRIIDLGHVVQHDSSLLTLLLHWLRFANERAIMLLLKNAPPSLIALAKVTDLDKLLPFDN